MAHLNGFAKKVFDTIIENVLIEKGMRVGVAVSGGADSVSLLLALNELNNARSFGLEIFVLHLDHQIRGAESEADSNFAHKLSLSDNFIFLENKVDVKSIMKPGESLEEAARKARYHFFQKTVKSAELNVIATGHTMDDQAETIQGAGSGGGNNIDSYRPVLPEYSHRKGNGSDAGLSSSQGTWKRLHQ